MTFDSDLWRLRLASRAIAVVAAAVGMGLLFQGLYLSAALCGVLCLCNLAGLATVAAHQRTRDLYREIRRMKSR